ncbi:MAG: type II toxin-antitoxin system HicB family antitoxin [Syntrophales bacterium]|jgi:predicted RNase H-like HicB family nuclease
MKTKHSILIQWSDSDHVFIASTPEIVGLNAFGDTPEEAVKELNVAKELYLQVMEEDKEPIPPPDLFVQHSGQLRIRIPKSLHLSLSQEAKKEGVSLNTFISHLLSERNAFHKVKMEIEKNNRVLIIDPLSTGTGTGDRPFIPPVSRTELYGSETPSKMKVGIINAPPGVPQLVYINQN